jgi:hypothetical protein
VIELNEDHDRIQLSHAMAISFECYRERIWLPSRIVNATVDRSDILAVCSTHLSRLDEWGDHDVWALTLVALKLGTTTLRVTTECGVQKYSVSVVSVVASR